jgi:hypothetical protein
MVLEVMGRHTGWIALHSGIAGGGDVILIPEIPWTFAGLCRAVQRREAEGKRYTLVVVAEGATLPDGGLVHDGGAGERRQVKLGGIGEIVAGQIARRLDREVRTVVLGHLQRGGSPTSFDRVLATQFGAHAVRLVHEGRFGEMVCYQPPRIDSVPIAEAIRALSTVDPRGSAVAAARALGIAFGDEADDVSPFAAGDRTGGGCGRHGRRWRPGRERSTTTVRRRAARQEVTRSRAGADAWRQRGAERLERCRASCRRRGSSPLRPRSRSGPGSGRWTSIAACTTPRPPIPRPSGTNGPGRSPG